MNALEMIAHTRLILDSKELQGSGSWTDANLLAYLSLAQRQLWAIEVEINPWRYLRTATGADLELAFATVSPGLIRAPMPRTVFRIEQLLWSGHEGLCKIPVTQFEDIARYIYPRKQRDEQTGWFVGYQGEIYLTSPSVTLADLLFFYVQRPADLVVFTAVGGSTTETYATGGQEDLGTLRFDTSAYVGTKLQVVSANTAAPEFEIVTVSAFELATYPDVIFTHSAATEPVQAGDRVASISALDESFHEVVCYLAALRALGQEANLAALSAIAPMSQGLLEKWAAISRRGQGQTEAKMLYEP